MRVLWKDKSDILVNINAVMFGWRIHLVICKDKGFGVKVWNGIYYLRVFGIEVRIGIKRWWKDIDSYKPSRQPKK